MVNTFIFMGLPGAGKGKQSEMLSDKTGFIISTTGGELRKLAQENNPMGQKIKQIMSSGGLNPSWLASYIFQKTLLNLATNDGVVFEGVGRKELEAKLFSEVCEFIERDFRIFNLKVTEPTAKERLHKRREIEGREDDNPEILQERFENYHKDTALALEYFRSVGKVIDIDGEPLPDEVFAQVWAEIQKL